MTRFLRRTLIATLVLASLPAGYLALENWRGQERVAVKPAGLVLARQGDGYVWEQPRSITFGSGEVETPTTMGRPLTSYTNSYEMDPSKPPISGTANSHELKCITDGTGCVSFENVPPPACHPTLSPDQSILALDGHCDAETVARMMEPAFVRREAFEALRAEVEVLKKGRLR